VKGHLLLLGRVILVLEQCMDSHNHQAVLRTAEAMGVQNVWLIQANAQQIKNQSKVTKGTKKITKNCSLWLNLRVFSSIKQCLLALKKQECTIWATDLSPKAIPFTLENKLDKLQLPPNRRQLAIVIGRETDGVSEEMLNACHQRVYFPLYGFSESLNLSVATALVLQRLFDWYPEIRGDLTEEEKETIRTQWYPQVVNNPTLAGQAKPWTENPTTISLLKDLRRPNLALKESWIPKNVRKKEQTIPEIQQRKKTNNDVIG
jgi:tRNA C32,U32 (ribose-2'-O)-methylase TrmJ